MDARLHDWMAPTIDAVQPWCDDRIVAAGTFQVAGGWASAATGGALGAFLGTLLGRTPKHVRERAGGLPDTVILAVGENKVFVFTYRTKRLQLVVGPPVRVWRRSDLDVKTDLRVVASKLTIDVRPTGDHHELESTSMTGRLGEITKEIFRLLQETGGRARRGAPPDAPRSSRFEADAQGAGRPATPSDEDLPKQRRLGEIAGEIEAEMRRLGWWADDPPAEETVLAGGAFGMNSVAFPTWLQVVFVTRLRQAAAGELEIPSSSSVATFAAREFDGYPEDVDRLLGLLLDVDDLVSDSSGPLSS